MSQFEHYKFLSDQFENIFSNFIWCLFTDDDDLLNPKRNSEFIKLVDKVTDKSEVCVQYGSTIISSWNKYDKSYEDFKADLDSGNNNTRYVSYSNEYNTYCVKLGFLKKFCRFLDKKNKIQTKLCDVVFSSMLFLKCNSKYAYFNKQPMYIYNQTSTHLRTCHDFGIEYYVKNYNDLFDDLSYEFDFKWKTEFPKGNSYIYDEGAHILAVKNIENIKDKNKINNKMLAIILLPIMILKKIYSKLLQK
jgi:hypothetical protein